MAPTRTSKEKVPSVPNHVIFQSFIQCHGHTERQQGTSPVPGIVGDVTPAPAGSSLMEQLCTTKAERNKREPPIQAGGIQNRFHRGDDR